MKRIKTVHSESQIQQSIIKKFTQERVIDQTAFYLNDGADIYYNPNKTSSKNKYDYSKIAQLLENTLTQKKGAKVAIVSLGCGSCEKDKIVLEHLKESGYDFSFFGVDSSMAMLYKANDILDNATFESQLICADFGVPGFKKELNQIIRNYALKIFLFFGNTLGNLNQGYIADVLKSTLKTDDYLLLDVAGFETITTQIQGKLFERYLHYINDPEDMRLRLVPIKAMGIPEDNGRLTLNLIKDDATQAQGFIFGFKINKLTTLDIEGGEVTLSSNEHIKLIHILVYDLNKLIKFLVERSFNLKDRVSGDFHHQLLLQKQ